MPPHPSASCQPPPARRLLRAAAFLFAAALSSGCNTTLRNNMAAYDANLARGLYAEAATNAIHRAGRSADDEPMWRLDAASAAALAGDPATALDQFDRAEATFRATDERGVARDAAETGLAIVWSDNARRYAATGPERVFCNLEKAFLRGATGDRPGALVEFNRALQRQRNYLGSLERAVTAAIEKAEKDAPSLRAAPLSSYRGVLAACRVDPEAFADPAARARAPFYNPYLLHAAGVFRALYGVGGADELSLAARLFPGSPRIAEDAAAVASRAGLPRGTVWVYVEDGLAPAYGEARCDLNFLNAHIAAVHAPLPVVALPALRPRSAANASYSIGAVALEPFADVDALVRHDFSLRFRAILSRECSRAVVKAILGVVAHAMSHSGDDTTRTVGLAAELGLLVYNEASAGADLRAWGALPKRVFAGRVPRPADGILRLDASGGRQYRVPVPPGSSMVLFRVPTAAAQPAAFVVSFPEGR